MIINTIVTVEEMQEMIVNVMAVNAMAADVMARCQKKLLCFDYMKTFLSSKNVLLKVHSIF